MAVRHKGSQPEAKAWIPGRARSLRDRLKRLILAAVGLLIVLLLLVEGLLWSPLPYRTIVSDLAKGGPAVMAPPRSWTGRK